MSMIEVKVPDIGDYKEVEVIEVLVSVGDEIAIDDTIISLESDKATLEVPSTHSGVIKELKISVGDKVSEGSLVLLLEASEEKAEEKTADKKAVTPPAQDTKTEAPPKEVAKQEIIKRETPAVANTINNTPSPINEEGFKKAYASPSVRKFARELGVDLSLTKGTGRKGRITREDVQSFVKQALSQGISSNGTQGIEPIPDIDFSQFGEIERQPLSRIKKISAKHLHRAWLNVPMVTYHDESDITELEAFRQSIKEEATKKSIKVTPLAFILKAVGIVLKMHPNFNASITPNGEELILKKYIHIGIAVDTPNGLVVPVIRDVDKKGIFELATEMGDISRRAREGKLKPNEMKGGCFSISSLGGIGGQAFTPLVNAPEVAILGLTRSKMSPVWNGEEFIPRLMQPLDLTFDHRVIDGAQGARFMKDLCALLNDFRRITL